MNASRRNSWILLAVLALCSCSPTRMHLKKRLRAEAKAERLIAKAVTIAPWILDTSTVEDTISVILIDTMPGHAVERTVTVVEHDTVYIDSGRAHVRIIGQSGGRMFVRAQCDTVFVEKSVEVPVRVPCPPHVVLNPEPPCPDDGWGLPWWVIAIMVALMIAILWHIARQVLAGQASIDPNDES